MTTLVDPLDDIENTQMDSEIDDATHSSASIASITSGTSTNGDLLPKSFLQLKGISIGNFNLGCNFHIATALQIIIHYNLSILAIQEHSPRNKELSEPETTSISKHCDKWGYFVTIPKPQIVIVVKQLLACHQETKVFEDGRIMKCRFEITENQFVTFIPVYGIPHSSNMNETNSTENTRENKRLQSMLQIQTQLQAIISTAIHQTDLLHVFGDLQDAPDNSKLFHYGSCHLAKHPLGIV
jgi:hypothetical protein